MNFLLAIIAAASLGVMFTVESTAWFIRSAGLESKTAQIFAVSNQYLYSTRLFAFIFQFIVALQIDLQKNQIFLWGTYLAAFLIALLLHLIIFFSNRFHATIWAKFFSTRKIAAIAHYSRLSLPRWRIHNKKLSAKILFSTMLLALAVTLPYFLAYIYSDFRMTFGSIAQVISFLGAVIIIYNVDPQLSQSMDKDNLRYEIYDYIHGRTWAYFLSFIATLLLFILSKYLYGR